jgi:hypothetical protein
MAPTPPQGRAGQHAGSRKDEQPEAPLQEERAWQQPGAPLQEERAWQAEAPSQAERAWQQPGAPSQEEGAWQPGAPSQEAGACSPAPAQFRAAWEEELTPVSRR